LQIKTKNVSCHTADSKPVKQEVNGTLMLPFLVFLDLTLILVVVGGGDHKKPILRGPTCFCDNALTTHNNEHKKFIRNFVNGILMILKMVTISYSISLFSLCLSVCLSICLSVCLSLSLSLISCSFSLTHFLKCL
jgi:hypothetical protein